MGGSGSGRIKRVARADQKCSKCGELGHRVDKCGIKPKAAAKPEPPRKLRSDVAAGADFIVIETVLPEPSGPIWIGDEVWTAIAPTGRKVDDAPEWKLRRQGIDRIGFPDLYPFLRRPPAGASMNVPLIGMQLRRPKAEECLTDGDLLDEPTPPAARAPHLPEGPKPKPAPPVLEPSHCLVLERTRRPCSNCRRPGDLDSVSVRAA